jgi:hypothetical protein
MLVFVLENITTEPHAHDIRADDDHCCEKLSEFPVDMFVRLPAFFLYLRFTAWILAHARTNRLSTMLETTLG